MNLRPQAAVCFELVLARNDLLVGLRALASTRAVELLPNRANNGPPLAHELRTALAPCNALLAEHNEAWPQPQPWRQPPGDLLIQTREAVHRLIQWRHAAGPLLAQIHQWTATDDQLAQYQALAQAVSAMGFALARLAQAGPVLETAFALLQAPASFEAPETGVLYKPFPDRRMPGGLLMFPRAQHGAVQQQLAALKGKLLPLPADWRGSNTEIMATLSDQRAGLRASRQQAQEALQQINEHYAAAQQVGWLLEMRWLLDQLPAFHLEAATAHASGWSALPDPQHLTRALEGARVRGIARRAPPPANVTAPMVLRNPGWAQPFEVFIRALGMPGAAEADPSILLVGIAPLIFGYMFGDAGQGLILILSGILLQRRYPLARLLAPGGGMAVLFGVLYGSFFSMQGFIPPLWVDPLRAPLTILAAPLAGGFVLLSLGMLVSALEAWWQKRAVWWLHTQMGLLLAYCGAGWTFAHPSGLYLLILGLLWHFFGYWHCRPGSRAILEAAASLLEQGMQLAVNTLSFVRIGAFALAHAGLSMALVSLAQAAGWTSGRLLMLVLGNAIIIVLETMVVSIQTTRLILLEFFLRFAAVHGRQLRPLARPTFTLVGERHHEAG